jgi:hypothetical protein
MNSLQLVVNVIFTIYSEMPLQRQLACHFEPTAAVGMPLLNQQRHLRYFNLTKSGSWYVTLNKQRQWAHAAIEQR